MSRLIEGLWYGTGPVARSGRLLLGPAEWLYGVTAARRNAKYDLHSQPAPGSPVRASVLPCLSVGNLTVGGTGKTPFAAWCVRRLRELGARPSIVMRGYGDDEWKVHGILNPGVPVIVSPDRIDGVLTARTRGADCAVLDDAFQHRRASRVSDIVLVSADQFTPWIHLLPRGPYRERPEALRRASAVVITQKSSTPEETASVARYLAQAAPGVPQVRARIVPDRIHLAALLVGAAGKSVKNDALLSHDIQWLRGRKLQVVSGIGNPGAFEAQMASLGVDIVRAHRFRDHHTYTAKDVQWIADSAGNADAAICTLKDAVKLAQLWPQQAPALWYVSQSVRIDSGSEVLEAELQRVIAARQ